MHGFARPLRAAAYRNQQPIRAFLRGHDFVQRRDGTESCETTGRTSTGSPLSHTGVSKSRDLGENQDKCLSPAGGPEGE